MTEKLTADAHRRRSLRVVQHPCPITALNTEDFSTPNPHSICFPVNSGYEDKGRTEKKKGAMTDRPVLPTVLVEENPHSQFPTPNLYTGPKKTLPVQDPSAFQHLHQLYMELQLVQSLPLPISPIGRFLPLPPPSKKRTLVLDLDETLIHRQPPGVTCETVLTVEAPQGSYLIGLNLRPYLSQVLAELEKSWELIVFTAAQKSYADTIIDYLDPSKRLISHRLYREHCLYVNSKPIKDLSILSHRNLANTVIVDNSIHSFAYHLNNGVPIPAWRGSLKDRELLKLNRYLKKLVSCEDVREEIRKTFDLEHFCREFRRAERRVGS